MERKGVQPSTSKGEPPSKRRKTDTFDDDNDDDNEWDDDFTAADLDDINDTEIRASQACNTSRPSTSHITFEERDTTDTFLKPHLSRSSSSTGNHSNGGAPSRLSRSSSSTNSSNHPHSDSSYPGSLSGYSGASSASIRSSSGEQTTVFRRRSYISNGSSSDSDTATSAVDEINRIKTECAQLKQQLTKLNEELCVKDGENKLLRDNLGKKEGELDGLKSEKVNFIHQQTKQQVEKEKQLQNDLARLQTQLQFKEQDERELSNRVKELESQVAGLKTGPASSQMILQQSSPKPSTSKVQVMDISPEKPSKLGFPTKRTFMAAEGSPKKVLKLFAEDTPSTSKSAEPPRRRENKLRLNTKVWKRSCECHLVSKLLDVSPCITGQSDYRSIVGLLSSQWISSNLPNVQFDRDKDTSLLSPIKGRLSDVNMLLNQSGREFSMVRLVPPDHFNLAMKGLKQLLNAPATSLSQTGSYSHMTLLDLDLSQSSESDTSVSQTGDNKFQRISSTLGQSTLDSAILLLPMVQDYLQHYIDMLETSIENMVSSSGISLSSSESFDSVSESPTGSLGILLRSTASCANNLESLAIAALRTLCTLVNYECVRKVLCYIHDEESSSESSSSSFTSSIHGIHLPIKVILRLRVLPKVIKLAATHTKGQLANKEVVETSLTILEILAKHSQDTDVNNLLPVMTDDVIQHCVENEEEPSFVLHGLILFKALCKSKVVVSSLCSNPTGCVLMSIYSIGIGRKSYVERENQFTLSIIKMVVESIFYIASCHKGGILLLMESDCQCSAEVVKCIVMLLYKVLKIYRQHGKAPSLSAIRMVTSGDQSEHVRGACLDILETGLLLLHLMSQHDQEFVRRHEPVQHYYVMLICGMSQLVRQLPADKSESTLTAIQDLWDFNQDDSELSPDSDTDMTEERD